VSISYIEKIKSEESSSDCSCEEYDGDPDITWQVDKGSHDKYWDLWMSPEEDASRFGGKDVIALRTDLSRRCGFATESDQ
jgi:hypothetical protein